MAEKGKLIPNCVHACNPYHECTEACLRKVAQSKPQRNGKNSDRQISKNKTDTACPRASNPYHECDAHCHRRTEESDSGEFHREILEKKRVLSNCGYASNPYHACTEACSRKIADSKPRTNKKNSDYCSVPKDPQIRKNKAEERWLDPGCPRASNPYHECDEHCRKQMTEVDSGSVILDVPLKLGRRNKQGSQQESPQVVHKITIPNTVCSSNTLSPKSNCSDEKSVDSRNHDGTYSCPTQPTSQNVMLVSHKDVPENSIEHLVRHTASATRLVEDKKPCVSPQAVPVTTSDDPGVHATTSAAGYVSSISSGVVNSNGDTDHITESVLPESRVLVGRYCVKGRFASTMRSIFDKHGDVAAYCQLESDSMLSYYLECTCFVIQELKSMSVMQLTPAKVKEFSAILKDVESAEIKVSWLNVVLDKLAEGIESASHYQAIKVAKANCDRDIESTRKQIKLEVENLAEKEKEVAVAGALVAETRGSLMKLELKSSDLRKRMLSMKFKVDSFNYESLLDDLL